MTTVKFLELGRVNEPYLMAFSPVAQDAWISGTYIGGKYVEQFEQEFANFCGVKHCVSVANGLDALVLALRALDIGPGDEVIVPAQTFIATWLAVSTVGATIVPVDVDRDSANIDPLLIEAAISSRTKAIVPVHLYGAMADMTSIMKLADQNSLWVIEDAAQAHGAWHGAKRAGSIGHIGCFSFYPSKNLGALGDAGGVITDDPALADRVRLIANYGSKIKYIHREIGANSRMDPIQAAFLSLKLASLDDITSRRKTIAEKYSKAIEGKSSLCRLLQKNIDCVWHNFVLCADNRDHFVSYMNDRGIGTGLHYPVTPAEQECYNSEFGHLQLPVSLSLASQNVSLPIGEYLNLEEVEHVVSALRDY